MPLPPNSHVEITVLAAASGQAVINVLNYKAHSGNAGVATLAQLAAAFREEWKDNICPELHESYEVQAYLCRTISGMVFLPPIIPGSPTSRPALRYSEQVIVQGLAADVGGMATASHPTFTAVSIQKVCGPVTTPALVPLTSEKLIKGGMRLGPIAEASTDTTEGNALSSAFATEVLDALNLISTLTAAGETFNLEVLSFYKDSVHRVDGALPTFARAGVTSFLVNPYASTQVTRKQRARGGA